MWEVKKKSRFLFTGLDILPSCGCNARETMLAKCELVLWGTSPGWLTLRASESPSINLNHIWRRTFPFKALIAIFWDLQPLWPPSLTKNKTFVSVEALKRSVWNVLTMGCFNIFLEFCSGGVCQVPPCCLPSYLVLFTWFLNSWKTCSVDSVCCKSAVAKTKLSGRAFSDSSCCSLNVSKNHTSKRPMSPLLISRPAERTPWKYLKCVSIWISTLTRSGIA